MRAMRILLTWSIYVRARGLTVRGVSAPRFIPLVPPNTNIMQLSKWYPLHIPRTKIAPLLNLKNKPKTVDYRGI